MSLWFKGMEFEIGGAKLHDLMTQAKYGLLDADVDEIQDALDAADTITVVGIEKAGYLGKYIYMPDVMGYGWTLGLIALSMALWYIIVTWNEESNKLIVPM